MRTHDIINEGANDPHIFKAVFLVGGPGAGKSSIGNKLLAGEGLKIVNSDIMLVHLMKKKGLDLKFPDHEEPERTATRDQAKELTAKMKINYLSGRLGLIIDGTGRHYNKIDKIKAMLEQYGYDTMMVFVNTSIEVSFERNAKRERSIPEDIVKAAWQDAQDNLAKFESLFGTSNFLELDNSYKFDDPKAKQIVGQANKQVQSFLRAPVNNPKAKQWLDTQKNQ